MKHFLKLTLPTLIVMLVICEAILWIVPVKDPYEKLKMVSDNSDTYIPSQFPPNIKFHFQSYEGLPGIDSSIIFSTNNYGFRGRDIKVPKDTNNYRVFLLGGSTTECIQIDDKNSNNKLLEDLLNDKNNVQNFEVYNAGKSGDITVDHIAMLSHKIVHLQPDCVVLFCGVNDLRRSGYDYTHNNYQFSKHGRISYVKLFLSNFQLFRRVHNLFKKTSIESIPFITNYKTKVKATAALPFNSLIPRSNLSSYEINLKTIIGICKANNIELILVTQATTWDTKDDIPFTELNWLNFIGTKRYPEKIMREEMEKYNDVMRRLGTETNLTVFDLAKEIKASRKYFFDDCHFNNTGALFYAERLSELIHNKISK